MTVRSAGRVRKGVGRVRGVSRTSGASGASGANGANGAGGFSGVRGTRRRWRALGEAGMTTAEYAVGTMAAVAFAALLLAIVRSGPVKGALTKVILTALGTGS